MKDYSNRVLDAVEFVKSKSGDNFSIGIILGSGLGKISSETDEKILIPYNKVPGFPERTILGHRGELLLGKLGGKKVAVLNGRFHYYQGYSLEDVTLPVRVLKRLGVEILIITNASGGINRSFKPGDIMLINDHINLMGGNPLIGRGMETFGPLFVDMTEPYDKNLIDMAKKISLKNQEIGVLREGVYLATSGPSYETRAEISFFEKIGADAVGMSTVPEVIVARQENMRVLGISVISNMACGIKEGKLSHKEVLDNVEKVGTRIIALLREVVKNV